MSDDDNHDLVAALLARVGMIMEDASIIALSSASGDQGFRVAQLKEAVNLMSALLDAAEALRNT